MSMDTHTKHSTTAILVMAVVCLGVLLSGCATSRQANDIMSELRDVKARQDKMADDVAAMDSLVTASTQSNLSLQNDVRYSMDQINQQMEALLENYRLLIERMQTRKPDTIRVLPRDSDGAQGDTTVSTDSAAVPPPVMPNTEECINAYDSSFTLLRRGEYETAIESFTAYMNTCPDHEDIENAYYWIGECYYALEEYTTASEQYKALEERFPDSDNLSRALYKLARCYQELGKTGDARSVYDRIVKDFPGTLEAEQASQRLKDL